MTASGSSKAAGGASLSSPRIGISLVNGTLGIQITNDSEQPISGSDVHEYVLGYRFTIVAVDLSNLNDVFCAASSKKSILQL